MNELLDRAPRLNGSDVHVWVLPLKCDAEAVPDLERALSPDEIARADRFVFAHLRRRYVVARGALRFLLGTYLDTGPESITFAYMERGKPVLDERHRSHLVFNVSHSQELALIAVSTGGDLGVDVEALRPMPDAADIAERFFSPVERAALRALPAASRDEAFFACWTRKEAYIKAIGDGLTCPLDTFDVSCAPDEPARLLAISHASAQETKHWSLIGFRPTDGYVGAVAVRQPVWSGEAMAPALTLHRFPTSPSAMTPR